ncbi:hypothetical protein DFJ77DRAFT_450863 [Powellomyces hirtus]|nr:hypothetical protein DFJ77DRAFT_450863 [Powellomyces hirtus]
MNVGSRQSADQAGDVASRTNASMTDFQRRLSLAYKQNRSMRGMNAPASHVVTVEPPAKIRDTPYQKFRRVARMVAHSVHFVKFLARILKNPIEWSWEYDPKTYSEDDVSHSTSLSDSKTKGHASGIPLLMSHEIFGVSHLFMKPKKFQGWLDNDMRSLFRKKPQNRTKHDLDIMATWCSTMKCMEKYPTSVQRALLGAAIYTRWNSSRQICKESHPVGRFYMILDGEVEISKIDRAKVIGARNKTMALASHITSRRMTVASDASDPRATTANLELVKEEPVNSAAVQAAIDARQATAEGLAARRNARAAVGEEGAPVASLTEEEMMEDAKAVKQIEDDLNKAYTITMGYMGAGGMLHISDSAQMASRFEKCTDKPGMV